MLSPADSRRKLREAIIEDATMRRQLKPTDGVYPLEAVEPYSRLDGIPLIQSSWERRTMFAEERVFTVDQFRSRFDKAVPELRGFDLRKHGIVVAGGSVSSLVLHKDPQLSDLDLFLVGHQSDEEAKKAIDALIAHVHRVCRGIDQASPGSLLHDERSYFTINRTKNCLTLANFEYPYTIGRSFTLPEAPEVVFEGRNGPSTPIQIILRRYNTQSEVILSFDMGSSAVLWDGEKLLFTRMGVLAFTHGVNVLNLEARRGSLEKRLIKYHTRGFAIALPGLDMAAFEACRGKLPYLTVYHYTVAGTTITSDHLGVALPAREDKPEYRAPPPNLEPCVDDTLESSMGDYSGSFVPYLEPVVAGRRNLRALISGGPHMVERLWAVADYRPGVDVYGMQPEFPSPDQLWGVYDSAGRGVVNMAALTRELGSAEAAVFLATKILGSAPALWRSVVKAYLVERIEQAKVENTCVIPFEFMHVQENTCLIGPFTRAYVSPADWYGLAGHVSLQL